MMFYALAVGSMLGYAVQNTLLVRFARSMDGLSLALYRNASFVVTLTPLLLGSTADDYATALTQWPLLLLSAGAGGIALALSYLAVRFLSVGVSGAFTVAASAALSVPLGWMFLHETVSALTMLFIGVAGLGCVALGFQRMRHPHLEPRILFGFLICAVASVFFVITRIVLASLSRASSPLVSGYFWEISIAAACALFLLVRTLVSGKGLERITVRQFLVIAACSLPTAIGTGLYAFASRMGSVAVLSVVSTLSLIVSTLLAVHLYNERLSRGQWLSMLVILAGVVGLKLT